MTIGVRSHQDYQRAALLLVGVGAGLALVLGARGLSAPEVYLVVLGAVGFALVARQLNAREATEHGPGRFAPWILALVSLGAGLGAAGAAFPALNDAFAPAALEVSLLALLGQATVGALLGLVSSVGLLGAQLVLTKGDDLEARLAAGRAGLEREERALAERAVVAHRRLALGLAGEASAEARRLQHTARAMTLEVLALAARASGLCAELRAVDRAALAARVADLAAAARATSDVAARADFTRASRAAAELERHLTDLDAAADRVRARLALQVGALESAASALATRRASTMADQALALAPLLERLDEAGAELRAEASALCELGAQGR